MKFILFWSKKSELKIWPFFFTPTDLFWEQCVGPGPSLHMCTSTYAKSISWGWLMYKQPLLWPWPDFGYCVPWLMAKPWVEGGCFEECSGKWGWKNKERERTKVKWLKNSFKFKKKEKYSRITNKKRKESLTQMKKEGKQQGERIGETGQDKVI